MIVRSIAGALVLVLLCGCSSDDESVGVMIAIEKRILEEVDGGPAIPCFAKCRNSGDVPGLAEQCRNAETTECGFVAGEDEIRVSLQYRVKVAATTTPGVPKLRLTGNDKELEDEPAFVFSPHDTKKASYEPVAVARFYAPSSPLKSLAFRAVVPDGVNVATESTFSVGPAEITVDVDQCPSTDCILASGVGSATATVHAPPGLAGKTATVASLVSGRIPDPATTTTTVLALDTSGRASGTVALDVPDGVGRTWTLKATVEKMENQRTVTLRAPADPLIGLGAANSSPNPKSAEPPKRAISEPSANCRAYVVAVQVPDPPSSQQALLESTAGTLDGKDGRLTLSLDAQGEASAEWVLPEEDTTQSPVLSLDVDEQRSARLTVKREVVLPLGTGGVLSARQKNFTVDATGTPDEIVLRGVVQTVPRARFSPGSKVLVRTRVFPDSGERLPCGTPVSATILKCDPTAMTVQERGSCFLAPFSVPIQPDGTYEVPLAAGFCFAGEVEINTLSQVYTAVDESKCLGELDRSPGVEPVGTLNLTFEAPPPGDASP